MKKVFSLLAFILSSAYAIAQHGQEEVTENAVDDLDNISDDTKWVMVTIWTIIIIILVLRTFRNKPDV